MPAATKGRFWEYLIHQTIDAYIVAEMFLGGSYVMDRADTCDWYNQVLQAQLCWYFRCSREDLLTMLDRREEVAKEQEGGEGDSFFFVSFKTPQQNMPRECITLVFKLPAGKSHQFKRLDDWYYTGSLPEYRFKSSAPNPKDPNKLYVVGGGF